MTFSLKLQCITFCTPVVCALNLTLHCWSLVASKLKHYVECLILLLKQIDFTGRNLIKDAKRNGFSFDFQTLIFFVLSQFLNYWWVRELQSYLYLWPPLYSNQFFWPSRQSMCTLTLFKPLYNGHMHLSTMALATKEHP